MAEPSTEAESQSVQNGDAGDGKPEKQGKDIVFAEPCLASGVLSFSEITLFSIGLNMWDRYVLKQDYAKVNWSTMKDNLTAKWFWDYDPFTTNQLGHPYQGSIYYSMAR